MFQLSRSSTSIFILFMLIFFEYTTCESSLSSATGVGRAVVRCLVATHITYIHMHTYTHYVCMYVSSVDNVCYLF